MKLQYFGHLMQRVDSLEDFDAGKDSRQKKRAAEDEMVRQHHLLYRHESEQTLGDGEGQRGLVCCVCELSNQTTTKERKLSNCS